MAERFRKTLRKARNLRTRPGHRGLSRVLDELEAMDPPSPRDRAARGIQLAKDHRYREAMADFGEAVSGGVEDPEVYYVMAVSRAALGERGKALRALRRAVSLLPGWEDAVYALCWELELAGRYGEALAELRRYKRLTGANVTRNRDIYRHWGRIRGRQGKWRLAYASFARAVWMRKPDPDDSEVVRRNYRRMTEMRRAAKKRDPADPRSFWLLAAGLHQAGWNDLAIDVMYTAARMRPVADAYRNVGEMYEQAFRFPDSVDAYIDGIRTLSGSVPPAGLAGLYEGLVVVLFASGRRQEALKYGEEAASLGIAGSEIRLRCESVYDDPDREDPDPVSMGQTTPHYEAYITEAERERLEAGG